MPNFPSIYLELQELWRKIKEVEDISKNDKIIQGNILLTSSLGISLNQANKPLITRNWDTFTTGDYKGIGRWGLFMEPGVLVAGIPDTDVGARWFSVSKYSTSSVPTWWGQSEYNVNESLFFVENDGNVFIPNGSLTLTSGSLGIQTGSITLSNGSLSMSNGSLNMASGSLTIDTGSIYLPNGSVVAASYSIPAGNIETDLKITSSLGIALNAADNPLITRAHDPFSAGAYTGIGRWGLFMEQNALVAGIPSGSVVGDKYFYVASYSTASTINQYLFKLKNDGNAYIPNGNLKFETTGKGIDFSVTSDGAGTATSELFSDYEEGTWSPNGSFGGSPPVVTAGGIYTKIGRVVYVSARFYSSSPFSIENVTGLPYQSNSSSGYAGSFMYCENALSPSQFTQGIIGVNATIAYFNASHISSNKYDYLMSGYYFT